MKGMVLIWKEVKNVQWKEQMCYVVQHNNYRNNDGTLQELHCVVQYFKCEDNSNVTTFFDQEETVEAVDGDTFPAVELNPLPMEVRTFNFTDDDLRTLQHNAITVDDNNAPLPRMKIAMSMKMR
jgi:hypothetical protein